MRHGYTVKVRDDTVKLPVRTSRQTTTSARNVISITPVHPPGCNYPSSGAWNYGLLDLSICRKKSQKQKKCKTIRERKKKKQRWTLVVINYVNKQLYSSCVCEYKLFFFVWHIMCTPCAYLMYDNEIFVQRTLNAHAMNAGSRRQSP